MVHENYDVAFGTPHVEPLRTDELVIQVEINVKSDRPFITSSSIINSHLPVSRVLIIKKRIIEVAM